ncbi:dihydrofolate reductase family protein [Tenggerimyces flavus]|uniref:Dihydrofolate reductase family protein n=1 Tax=Tenggerimyces flavus TaxID=1708749 RepID=A0ABV7YE96_9ACTN|nr:dihydrofolate reductase family protein [Tenggerimyces flavus]MBM7788202.1 dihydrofolate reductase [Tenggerimyces flavus]
MSASVLFMSMSLDGFIAGLNDGPDNPGGDDGAVERLHEWSNPAAGDARSAAALKEMEDAMNATGAVVAGRRTVEQVDHWGGDHHGTPIVVVSHSPAPAAAAKYPMVTYVTDGIESAMAQAKTAAGDRDVFVHGAYTAQRALEAGVLDELQIHQIPVLLGAGLRQFEVLGSRIELDIIRVIDTPTATHIRFRVRR